MTLLVLPRSFQVNSAGQPYGFARLTPYAAGTTTPLVLYALADLSVPLPSTIQADAAGLFPAMYSDVTGPDIRLVLESASGALLYDEDNIPASPVSGIQLQNLLVTLAPFAITPAELALGMTIVNPTYLTGNVLRYGLVPNSPGSAANNTAILRQLVSYKLNPVGWTGQVTFENTTGADKYWFNDFVDFREGISVDLRNCTWKFSKAAASGNENNAGAIMAIRDFTLENGTIDFDFPTSVGTGCTALFLGARGNEGVFFNPFYDAVYFAATGRTMGEIEIRKLNITSNAPGQRCISMLGGLQNVLFETVAIDGQGVADGFYGEYGFATDGAGVASARQSSHANNVRFVNCKATNLVSTGSGGISYNGAYGVVIDELRVLNASSAFSFGFGEAYYVNPWSGQDGSASNKRTFDIRGVIGKGLTGSGGTIQGANTSSVATGYAAGSINALAGNALFVAQSDLVGGVIDGFSLSGTSAGNGLQIVGADSVKITNGRIVGFGNGINCTAEVTDYIVDNVKIFDSTGNGINIGNGFPVWSPTRNSNGVINKCFIAGSGSSGINLAFTDSCKITANRFGYLAAHDNKTETTQDAAVTVASTATGVVCDGNFVAAVASGVAYVMSGTVSGGNNIVNATGVATNSGLWENALKSVSPNRGDVSFAYTPHVDFTTQLFGTALTVNRAMTLSGSGAFPGDRVRTVRTGLGAFTLTVNGTTVLPISATAWCEHEYNGTAWVEIGAGTPLL